MYIYSQQTNLLFAVKVVKLAQEWIHKYFATLIQHTYMYIHVECMTPQLSCKHITSKRH